MQEPATNFFFLWRFLSTKENSENNNYASQMNDDSVEGWLNAGSGKVFGQKNGFVALQLFHLSVDLF